MSESVVNHEVPNVTPEPVGFRIVGDPTPLFAALAKAQGEFGEILKTRQNPFFNSKYADLADVINATRAGLQANGLALFHPISRQGDSWTIRTILAHSSGSYLETTATVPPVADWQKFGSAVTYCRRYVVSALLGVASEVDDDGNAASDAKPREQPRTSPTPPKVERPKPAPQSAPPKAEAPKPAPEERQEPSMRAVADAVLEGGPPPEGATGETTAMPAPPAEGEKAKKETITYARELVMELGMTKMVPEWCQKLLGVQPAQITLESQWQVLVADLEKRKADRQPKAAT